MPDQRTTYPTKCRDCSARVFFHSEGFGDGVLFDALGWPWPIHSCYQTNQERQAERRLFEYRTRSVALYGSPHLSQRERQHHAEATITDRAPRNATPIVGITSAVGERAAAIERRPPETASRSIHARESTHRPPKRAKPQAEPREILDIVRCDPRTYPRKQLEITGYVQDVHTHRPLSRLAEAGSKAYSRLQKRFGSDWYTQMTVIGTIDPVTGEPDLISYTMAVPKPTIELVSKDVVAASIEPVKYGAPFYLCTQLAKLDVYRIDAPNPPRAAGYP